MAEHSDLTGASLHECKLIDTAGTGDAGMVITPSAVDAGEGVLRNLVESEIDSRTYALTCRVADIGGTTPARLVVPFTGTLTTVYTVIDAVVATADAVLTIAIDGVSTTPATLTIAYSGSAAGDIDTVAITNNNSVVPGDLITVTSDGGPSGSTGADVTLIFTKA